MADQRTPAVPPLQFKRAEDFTSLYANNAQFETSVWSLKIIFGELDQSEGKQVIEQHTAITLPWVLVKLASYFLQTYIAGYELENGKITIPPAVMPPEFTIPETLADNPQVKEMAAVVNKIRAEFIAKL